MLFLEEDAPLLKAWIVKRLENTSDADADVLADYVLALLRHEGDLESIRKLCEQETHDFLQEDSTGFIDDVFKAIAFKTYLNKSLPTLQLPNSSTPPTFPSQTQQPPRLLNPNTPSYVPHNANGLEIPFGPSLSRKRTYHDRGGTDYPNGFDLHGYPDGRGGKFARRGGRGGRRGLVDSGYMHLASGAFGVPRSSYPGTGPSNIPQLPPLDPNDIVGSMMRQWQALGIPVLPVQEPALYGGNRRQQSGPRRKRCRDFDTKGICARGQACPFDHGSEPVFYPLTEAMVTSEEYDPNNAVLANANPEHMMAQFHPYPDMPHIGPASTSRGGRSGHRPKGCGSRSPYSADGPIHDHSNTAIVIENIPEESFGEDQIRQFFGQFGEIVKVSMQPYKRLAIVKYTHWGAANAAYRSPKAIFDNRFVKVFWSKSQNGEDRLPTSILINGGNKKGAGIRQHSEDGEVSQEDEEIDMEEFLRKQEEAQKAYQERERRRAELDRKHEELAKLQEELLAKQLEEKRRLQEKLAPGGDDDVFEATNKKAGTSTERLRAQLAALEEEAKTLGIDPDAIDVTPSTWTGNPRGGYGYGSRARAAYGGRGGFVPRGHSVGYRGRADVRAAYAAYSLDNRPKVVAVSGADFTDLGKDETLRHHLLKIGEFKDIRTSTSTTYITFSDRKTAEKFMAAGDSISGMDEKLELSWSTDSEANLVVSAASKTDSKPVPKQAQGPGHAAAAVPKSTEEHDGGDDSQETGNGDVDYDVADENEWGS